MIRILYRLLVLLHPPAFRREFGDEMLWIFCESKHRRGFFFRDALVSLARQWMIRTGVWIPAAACACTAIPFWLAISVGRAAHRVLGAATYAAATEFFMFAALTAVFAISATLAICVAWFRYSRLKHRV